MKRILVADDDLMTHKMIERELKDYDIRITPIFTGIEAILQIKHRHFDFVFVDNFLGTLMGTEVINAVKGVINGSKVYLISGVAEKAQTDVDKSGAKVHGVIDKSELIERMKSLLADEFRHERANQIEAR